MSGRAFFLLCLPLLLSTASTVSSQSPDEPKSHWAFRPLMKAAQSKIKNTGWPRNPIDQFVLKRLEEKGLRPNRAADRRMLIRRASFDLIGLPPSPAEVEMFIGDPSPNAWEKVVDRLLASPHYGERWGRHWLDVVRYADTAGETADYPVPDAYRYRNYVINAFNQDLPYDEFIREQVAGDILARQAAARGRVQPDRFAELVTATGFLAISRRFGYDTERYEHLTIADTIEVLGQAFQGLTLGCARCHDHKYDPVSMADYYGLYGIFAGTRYAFTGSERLQSVRALVPLVPPAEAKRKEKDFYRRLTELERLRQEYRARAKADLPGLPPVTMRWLDGLDGDFELQGPPQGGSLGLPANPWTFTGQPMIDPAAQSPFTDVYPRGANGVAFPAGAGEHTLGRGLVPAHTAADGPVSVSFDFRLGGATGKATRSYRVFLGHERGKAAAVELYIGPDALFVRNGSALERIRTVKPEVWYKVRLTIDLKAKTFRGVIEAPGDIFTFPEKSLAKGSDGRLGYFKIDTHGQQPGSWPGLYFDNFAVLDERDGPLLRSTRKSEAGRGVRSLSIPELKERILNLQKQVAEELEHGPFPQAYAAWEGTPQDVRIQKRGEPDRPGRLAPRGFLEVFGGQRLPPGADGSGRRELADWLASKESPLTARVMVNRIWQHHFGTGLVATPNDFGTRGQPPTHPGLLDWLARRFIESGWSVKAMHRLILLSNTYQMSSADNVQAAAVDPVNRLLARFPRRRLEAECIRDALLVLSGNLERGLAGPHPFPALPQQKYTQHAPFRAVYETNRRSIYLMTQRLRRHPFLVLFDGPDTNASTGERNITTVPTQALFLMNDRFVHRQSEGFARRLLVAHADDVGRIDAAFLMAFARRPTSEELADSLNFLRRYRSLLASAGVSEGEREVQAWAAVGRTVFARNEFLFVD